MTVPPLAGAASRPAAAAPADQGEWSPVYPLPLVAVHSHVLPSGRLLIYNDNYRTTGALSQSYVVDIPTGGAPNATTYYFNNEVNLFCAGHSFLPNGDLLVVGGQINDYYYGTADTTIFSEAGGGWTRPANSRMSDARWYPSVVALGSGEALALGGQISPTSHSRIHEVWQTGGHGWRRLTGASLQVPLYAWAFQAPNGHVFMAGPARQTRYLDTAGAGRWLAGFAHLYPRLRQRGSAVVYDEGKILVAGGDNPATNTAEIIDLNAASPRWAYTLNAMAFPRRMHNMTVLPDGKVLVTGGGSSGNAASTAVKAAEIWDPTTNRWTTLASMSVPRLYHSTAVLLPDGRVLSAGGGRPASAGGANNFNAEIFSPPYLFRPGPRPTIASAPTSVGYGQTFFVGTPDGASIARATLIRLSSTTHGLNMGQRLARIPSIAPASGGLNLRAPADPRLAPPGHYLLFILNGAGVPSVGKVVRIG